MIPGTYTMWCDGDAHGHVDPAAQRARLLTLTYEQAEYLYHDGRLSADEYDWYLDAWHTTPRFTGVGALT